MENMIAQDSKLSSFQQNNSSMFDSYSSLSTPKTEFPEFLLSEDGMRAVRRMDIRCFYCRKNIPRGDFAVMAEDYGGNKFPIIICETEDLAKTNLKLMAGYPLTVKMINDIPTDTIKDYFEKGGIKSE